MLDQFLTYLECKGYSKETLKAYRADLLPLLSGYEEPTAATLAFRIKSVDAAPATTNRKIAALKSYYAFRKKFGYDQVNQGANIAFRKKAKRLPKFDPALKIPDNIPKLDRLILTVLAQTGIRLNELCQIRKKDFLGNAIKVHGKGNKQRIVPLMPLLSEELAGWATLLSEDDSKESPLLFGLKRHQVQYLTRKYLGYNPHTIRHSFATALINNGASIKAIQDILGHSTITSTQVYTHLNHQKLIEIHKQCLPNAHK